MEGWVKLHRKILDNPIASNLALVGFFCYLLLLVSHKEKDFYLGNQKIHQNPGDCVISQKKLAKQFKISRGTINRRLMILQNETIIETNGTNKYTILTILNWEKYQCDGHQDGTQVDTKRTPREHQVDTINNYNNDNNIRYIERTEEKGKEKREEKEKQASHSIKSILEDNQLTVERGVDLLNEFVDYWSEPDKKGNERWTKEKTRDIRLRLKKWKWNKDTNFGKDLTNYEDINTFDKFIRMGNIDLLKQKLGQKYDNIKSNWKASPLFFK